MERQYQRLVSRLRKKLFHLDIPQTTRMLEQAMEEKLASHKCLQCDEAAASNRRGCCKLHYSQFWHYKRTIKRTSRKATLAAQQEFDREMVAKGMILAPHTRRQEHNPFKAAHQASHNPYGVVRNANL